MKVWFLLSRFEQGGMERVQIHLAQGFQSCGLDTSLVVGSVMAGARQIVPDAVPLLEIAPRSKLAFPFGLWSALRRKRPDVVFTTANDVACLMLLVRKFAFPKIRVICTQHSSISGSRRSARGISRVKHAALNWLMRRLLPQADRIVAVSNAVAKDMQRELELSLASIDVVHNPVVTPEFSDLMNQKLEWPWPDHESPTVVFAGRLSAEKRLDLLVDAFALLSTKLPARLLVLGDGPRHRWLIDQIEMRGLEDHCRLVGFQSCPLAWIHASDLLVLCSDFEGFGNVLVEAMACGTQVVATDCPYGPAEVLAHGKYGQLVPCGNAQELASAMQRCLEGTAWIPEEVLKKRAGEFGLRQAVDSYLRIAGLDD